MLDIQKNVSLAPYTTFRIGGSAKEFVVVASQQELIEALQYAKDAQLQFFVLGGGSNILFSDKGFDGLIIRMQDARCKMQDTKIECGAGFKLSEAVKLAKENSLSRLEWATGIPGTIGGAVRGNAGAYGSEMRDNIESVKFVELSKDELKIIDYKARDCGFAYRNSFFKQNKNLIILSCILELEKGEKKVIEEKMKEIIKKRTGNLPREASPGSFFKNPETDNVELIRRFEMDTGKKVTDHVSAYHYVGNRIKIPAPWLIEEVGLKGKKIGGAMVSEKHANFIVNTGDATAEDVIMLASLVKMRVRDEFGIQLHEEVQYVGF